MQFKGLGFPNKYFATQKKQMYIRLHCLRVLWSLSTCLPNLKIILQSGPSVFKFNLKRTVIFLHKNFRVCSRRKQGEPVPPRKFWTWFFTNPASKHLLGFAQIRCSAKKLRWPCILADAEWANFLGEKFVLWKSALIHSILHQTGTITSGFESKKRKYHFLKIWVLLWYALSRTFSKKRKHSFRFFLEFLLKYTENRKECFLNISASLWYAFYKPSSNLENRMTVCMGYPAMTPQGRAGKRRWKGVGSPCRENGTQNLKSRWYEKPEPVVPILPWNSFHIP